MCVCLSESKGRQRSSQSKGVGVCVCLCVSPRAAQVLTLSEQHSPHLAVSFQVGQAGVCVCVCVQGAAKVPTRLSTIPHILLSFQAGQLVCVCVCHCACICVCLCVCVCVCVSACVQGRRSSPLCMSTILHILLSFQAGQLVCVCVIVWGSALHTCQSQGVPPPPGLPCNLEQVT